MAEEIQNVTKDNYKQILSGRWLEYLHALGSVEGAVHRRYIRDGKPEGNVKDEIVCFYPFFRETRGKTETMNWANVAGKNYCFCLEKKEPVTGWMIEHLKIGANERNLADWIFPKHFELPSQTDTAGYNIFISLGVGLFTGHPVPNLPDIFQSGFFNVKKFEFIENEGKKTIICRF